jgi:dUTP pyrophosphatase
MRNNIKIKLLHPDAVVPAYATPGDAGADLVSIEYITLRPGERHLARTGIAVEIPLGYVGLVHPRSGLAAKKGITTLNAPGTIDSGYRGEIHVNLINLGKTAVDINKGDRIAQFVIQKVETAIFKIVDELTDSVRGKNGHGSTGS